ncbi:fibroleukin-like [Physella acuta]|uniref:fibroleukin-like n=1 Tax=Physella acuta TaxID=109671 RepID=UPI0027DDA444|nr:fibroleukin-like [Physella acuta]
MAAFVVVALLAVSVAFTLGLELDVKRETFVKGSESFCGRLRCMEDITRKPNFSAIVSLNAFTYTENTGKVFLTSIALDNPVAKTHNLAATEISGKISKSSSEISLVIRPVINCSYSTFGCQASILDTTGAIIQIENVSLSLSKSSSYDGVGDVGYKKENVMPSSNSNSDKETQRHGFKRRRSLHGTNRTQDDGSDGADGGSRRDQGDEFFSNTLHTLSAELEKLSTDAKGTYSKFNDRLDSLSNTLQQVTSAQQQSLAKTDRALADMRRAVEEMRGLSPNNDLLRSIETERLCKTHDSTLHMPSHSVVDLGLGKDVLCDTKTDKGGWIVIQRRAYGDTNFTRNWNDYKMGFGSLFGDFWMGNDFISLLTTLGYNHLRIDMKLQNRKYYASYVDFHVGNENSLYKLKLTPFRASVRDNFKEQNNHIFVTYDRSNGVDNYSCADWRGAGGWWFDNCLSVNLNGRWRSQEVDKGVIWADITEWNNSLDFVEMKVRKH